MALKECGGCDYDSKCAAQILFQGDVATVPGVAEALQKSGITDASECRVLGSSYANASEAVGDVVEDVQSIMEESMEVV